MEGKGSGQFKVLSQQSLAENKESYKNPHASQLLRTDIRTRDLQNTKHNAAIKLKVKR
jgi:hypothetical protein